LAVLRLELRASHLLGTWSTLPALQLKLFSPLRIAWFIKSLLFGSCFSFQDLLDQTSVNIQVK
jgi:hypothetical protein